MPQKWKQGCHRSGKNFCAVRGKAGNYILSQGKLIFFEKNSRVVEIITLLMKGWKKHFKSFVTDLNDVII